MALCKIPAEWDTRKRAIFQNSKRLFAKYGISEVTLEDIARGYKESEVPPDTGAGQVSRAMVKGAFKKDELLREIMRLAWESILTMMKPIVEGESPGREKLNVLLEKIPSLLEEDLDAVGVLVRERYPVSDVAPGGCPQAAACLSMLVQVIGQIADEDGWKVDHDRRRAIVVCLYGAAEHGMLDIYLNWAKAGLGDEGESRIDNLVKAHRRVEALIKTLKTMAEGALRACELEQTREPN